VAVSGILGKLYQQRKWIGICQFYVFFVVCDICFTNISKHYTMNRLWGCPVGLRNLAGNIKTGEMS